VYSRILLASDGSAEGMAGLREGALLAAGMQARAFLLIVVRETPGTRVADGIYLRSVDEKPALLMRRELDRLRRLGIQAPGRVVAGEPAAEIAAAARSFGADLVVVGHRRQSFLERWWSGSNGAYLSDTLSCSVLVARNIISDAAFEHILASAQLQTFGIS
jgi:nucleotide-binding universal stress UspA family protein